MKTEMYSAGGKVKLKNGDAQLPEQNRRDELYGMAGESGNSEPSGDAARGYTDGEKFGKSGKDNFHVRQQNPNDY